MISSPKILEMAILAGYVLLMTLFTGCGSDENAEPPAALP